MPNRKNAAGEHHESEIFFDAPAVLFENFSFKYKAQTEPTLSGINLKITKGEKILVLGPSGSGKSTLVHCINGIIPHAFKGESSGGLYLFGKNIAELDIFGISKIAGTVLQDTDGQFVGLSAAEDIAFALENDCVPVNEMRSRVLKTAFLVKMENHLDKSPYDLSGGQKQRISIAGILAEDSEILLFDEPLANLDPAAGKDAVVLIDELHKETGKTIIIVEHRLEDVLYRHVDRIVLMDNGKIIFDSPPEEILCSPLLKKTGIREPLYLSALAYAGVKISPGHFPQHLDDLKIDYKPLFKWDAQLSLKDADSETNSRKVFPETVGNAARRTCLEIQNLHFRYGKQVAETLKNISFSVMQGECVGLVGKNGSGKSTLAKCICGFVRPDSGRIIMNGNDLSDLSIMQRAEKIGYVMQNPNQMLSFPIIYDEVALGLRNRNVSEANIKNEVHEALQICGLYPFRNWPINALSYGQKKRLSIAAIIVMRPSLVILDEPTAGQDYRHYNEFMEFLLGLNLRLGISLILITHDMHLMLEYTTMTVVLSDGECIATDKPFEVLTNDETIERANLKRTSLYDLALNGGLSDPKGFVKRYIAFERKKQGRI